MAQNKGKIVMTVCEVIVVLTYIILTPAQNALLLYCLALLRITLLFSMEYMSLSITVHNPPPQGRAGDSRWPITAFTKNEAAIREAEPTHYLSPGTFPVFVSP